MKLYDNFVFRGLSRFLDMLIVSSTWLILCIPFVTIGASTSALYYVSYKTIRHERGYAFRGFLSSFKSCFKQATIIGLLFSLIFGCLGFDVYLMMLYASEGKSVGWYQVGLYVLLALVLAWSFYVFPYIARFNSSTKDVLKSTLFMMLGNPGSTLLLCLFFVIQCLGIYMYTPAIVLIPVLYNYFKSLVLEKVFRKYMTEEQIALENEKNGIYK